MAVTLAGGLVLAGGLCLGVGRADQLQVMLMTAGLCLAAAWIALLPVAWRARHSPSGLVEGFVIGVLLRLGLTGSAVVILGGLRREAPIALGLWAVTWYLLLLGVEVVWIKKAVEKAGVA